MSSISLEIDYDEEPPFKYTKVGADVSTSTLKDSASVLRCCDQFIVSERYEEMTRSLIYVGTWYTCRLFTFIFTFWTSY